MKLNSAHIDFELIRKKFKSGLSQEEETMLQAWLGADKRHQEYFDKAIFYLKEGKVFNQSQFDPVTAWAKTENKLAIKKTNKQVFLRIAGSVAAALVIFFSVYFMLDLNKDVSPVADNNKELEPGIQRAELVLSNGRIVRLGEGSNQITELDGTLINTDSSNVSYLGNEIGDSRLLYNEIKVDRGEEFTLTLADSTKVMLNSMSSIKFPVNFEADKRIVSITGEVYFDVKHNPHKPFVVRTPVHDIVVLGTTFNVSCYEDDDDVRTTLVEGSVEIIEITGGLDKAVLSPGKQFVYNKSAIKSEIIDVNTDVYTSWTSGHFQFDNNNLEDIFKKLQRWYHIDVFFVNNQARNQVFSGRLPRFKNVNVLLDMIQQVSDVEFDTDGNTIIIK